jgi:hypothetical protein
MFMNKDMRKPQRILALICGTILAVLGEGCAMSEAVAATDPQSPRVEATLVYDDLDLFAAAMAAIDGGADPAAAMRRYTENASPAFHFFAGRFGATAESMTEQVTRRPLYYRYLATLKPEIQAREPEFRAAIARLLDTAPEGSMPTPLYFMIANQTAGGNPGVIDTPDGQIAIIAVAIDVMALSPRVDLSEFPNGTGGRVELTSIPQVVVHEMTHVFQRQVQGLDNYVSIYLDEARGTHLAYAIREGCAEYLTWLASGWRLGDRHLYVAAHEGELWAAFRPVMHERQDDASGWFGGRADAHPDWPPQVGYGVGMEICRIYHEAAADQAQALRNIYGAYLPEHFDAIVAPYVARMSTAIPRAR